MAGAAAVTMTDVNSLSVRNALYNLSLNCRTGLANHSATVLDWDMILDGAGAADGDGGGGGGGGGGDDANGEAAGNDGDVCGDSGADVRSPASLPLGVKVSEVVLGADIICCEADSVAVARCISKLLMPQTGVAYVALTTGRWRFGVDQFPTNLKNVGCVLCIHQPRHPRLPLPLRPSAPPFTKQRTC